MLINSSISVQDYPFPYSRTLESTHNWECTHGFSFINTERTIIAESCTEALWVIVTPHRMQTILL